MEGWRRPALEQIQTDPQGRANAHAVGIGVSAILFAVSMGPHPVRVVLPGRRIAQPPVAVFLIQRDFSGTRVCGRDRLTRRIGGKDLPDFVGAEEKDPVGRINESVDIERAVVRVKDGARFVARKAAGVKAADEPKPKNKDPQLPTAPHHLHSGPHRALWLTFLTAPR